MSSTGPSSKTSSAASPRRAGRRRRAHPAPARGRQADRARAHRPAARRRLFVEIDAAGHPPLPRLRHGASSRSPATAWSPATARSTAAWSTSSPRTSPSSAARCPRPTPRRSARSWTWRWRTARRSSASTTRAARASRRASPRSAATPTSSCATRSPRAWCRRSAPIMGPCAGGAVYSPAITDFIFMVEGTSYMFVTGPDVIKTVTHEEVTKEELGGAHDPRRQERRLPLHRAQRRRLPGRHPRAALLPAVATTSTTRRPAPATDDPDREAEALDTAGPRGPQQALRHQAAHRARWSTTARFFEVHADYAQNIVVGFARLGGRAVGHRRQPAGLPRRRARHRRLAQGRALRALLRRLQHPAGHLRGRARLPARHRSRSSAASSSTAPSCSTPSPRRRCPRSR